MKKWPQYAVGRALTLHLQFVQTATLLYTPPRTANGSVRERSTRLKHFTCASIGSTRFDSTFNPDQHSVCACDSST